MWPVQFLGLCLQCKVFLWLQVLCYILLSALYSKVLLLYFLYILYSVLCGVAVRGPSRWSKGWTLWPSVHNLVSAIMDIMVINTNLMPSFVAPPPCWRVVCWRQQWWWGLNGCVLHYIQSDHDREKVNDKFLSFNGIIPTTQSKYHKPINNK